MNSLRGGGLSNILLVLSRDELVSDMILMTSLSESQVRGFCDSITWGFRTTTPDPALQPLIPLGSGMLAIPCLHLLSSDQERNLLSLLARVDPQSFDSQSHLFETDMIASLLSCTPPSGTMLRANINVLVHDSEEELDFVLLDKSARLMMVCELRWTLPPGDPREVQNRKNACVDKVSQLRRKVERLSKRPKALAEIFLGPQTDSRPWGVVGAVLIAGFAGTRSPDASYPIIPLRLFEMALNQASSLSALSQWCHSLTWLPREGNHFMVVEQEIPLVGPKPLKVESLSVPDSAANFASEALDSLSKRDSAASLCPGAPLIDPGFGNGT